MLIVPIRSGICEVRNKPGAKLGQTEMYVAKFATNSSGRNQR